MTATTPHAVFAEFPVSPSSWAVSPSHVRRVSVTHSTPVVDGSGALSMAMLQGRAAAGEPSENGEVTDGGAGMQQRRSVLSLRTQAASARHIVQTADSQEQAPPAVAMARRMSVIQQTFDQRLSQRRNSAAGGYSAQAPVQPVAANAVVGSKNSLGKVGERRQSMSTVLIGGGTGGIRGLVAASRQLEATPLDQAFPRQGRRAPVTMATFEAKNAVSSQR